MKFERLIRIAELEFPDVVDFAEDLSDKLRINLCDGSFVDVWLSEKMKDRYAYHWERRHIDGKIFRHDNIPHEKWEKIEIFPKHFHNGSENNVIESHIPENPEHALKEFLEFVRRIIKGDKK